MANPDRSIGRLMTVLFVVCLASLSTSGLAETPPGGDASPSMSSIIEPATPPSEGPPPDCAANDPRPECQVESRGISYLIRSTDKPSMCLRPIVAGSKGAEYELIVLSLCQFNDLSIRWENLWYNGEPRTLKHVQSGKCAIVVGNQLRLGLCTRETTEWVMSNLKPGPPPAFLLHVNTKMGTIPFHCLKSENMLAPMSKPGSPIYQVSVGDCKKVTGFLQETFESESYWFLFPLS